MPLKVAGIARHAALMVGLVAVLVFVMVRPYLPGAYDAMALPLSLMVQVFGLAGLLLLPVGVPWLIQEVRGKAGRGFALAGMIMGSLVVLAGALAATESVGVSLGVVVLAGWGIVLALWRTRLNGVRVPLYLVVLPVVLVVAQVVLAVPMAEFSRSRVIAGNGQLIDEIEEHKARFGSYPASLLALHQDYKLPVIGVGEYHYALTGSAYNLYFEQPRFLIDNFGTREIVMYNRLDEQIMASHDSWILLWSPEQLKANQGWYEVHDSAVPHWKYFWFD
ncbi:hypothetical protein [Acrocarpospora pleiomorpha]|nr:hypothetical protein [Acrocarpospora pleiomorpha]